MIFLAVTSYLGIGFACFLIVLFADRVFKLDLFIIIESGGVEKRSGFFGAFLIFAWPVLAPLLILWGIGHLAAWVCESLVKRVNAK